LAVAIAYVPAGIVIVPLRESASVSTRCRICASLSPSRPSHCPLGIAHSRAPGSTTRRAVHEAFPWYCEHGPAPPSGVVTSGLATSGLATSGLATSVASTVASGVELASGCAATSFAASRARVGGRRRRRRARGEERRGADKKALDFH
jgi:hypothetical protein